MHLSIKYWKHHKGRTIALFCAIMISTMAMTFGVFLARSASQTNVQNELDKVGNYDIVVPLVEEEELQRLSEYPEIAECETILNGGTCKTEYSEAVRFGAMNNENTQKLFHFGPEKNGRYPIAVGEICGYRSSFEELGIAPILGNRVELELYDAEGNSAGTKEFTIVGVLNDQRDAYDNVIRTMDIYRLGADKSADNIDYPELFVYREDIPALHTLTAIILCDPDSVPWQVGNILNADGIKAYNTYRLAQLSSIAAVSYETENELYERAHLAYNDFYSSKLIPIFMGIVLIVSFISVYGVMSGAMLDRQRQLGLFRSMGMSKRTVMKLLFGEAFLFDTAGVATGYVLGILMYLIYLQAVNSFGDVHIYSAFGVHPIAKAVSLSPYLYPWLLSIIFSALAVMIPLAKSIKLAPNEMLFPEKTTKINKQQGRLSGHGIVRRVVSRNLNRDKGVVFLILITGWTFVFGAAFMLGKSDFDSQNTYQKLQEVSGADADYSVSKDIYNTMWGRVDFNRHHEGISTEDLNALRASEDVADLSAVMKLPGVKLLYQKSTVPENLRQALNKLDLSNNIGEGLEELSVKSKLAQGYSEEDLLYGLPCVAIDNDFLESLEQYIVTGELDLQGLRDGSKIAIVEYPEGEMTNPYVVGDKVSLTDVVISDPVVESFDFSHMDIPPGYAPTFYYDDTDGLRTNSPGYSFGEKVVFDAEVCAVLYIDDENLEHILYSESWVPNEARTDYVSPGYNILCSTDAVSGWGLPDRCYTDVYVNLHNRADPDRFETLWYTVVGKSGKVNSVSRSAIERRIIRTELSNMVMFASMIVLIILTGCFGMVNSYHFAVKRNTHNLQILRAIGMSRKKVIYIYIKGMFLWPFIAVATSVIPIEIFDLVRRYAYHYAFDLNNNAYTAAANGKMVVSWQTLFPWYIYMWEQPIVLLMVIGFISIALINIAAGVIPMNKMKRMSIVDGIRNEDF